MSIYDIRFLAALIIEIFIEKKKKQKKMEEDKSVKILDRLFPANKYEQKIKWKKYLLFDLSNQKYTNHRRIHLPIIRNHICGGNAFKISKFIVNLV